MIEYLKMTIFITLLIACFGGMWALEAHDQQEAKAEKATTPTPVVEKCPTDPPTVCPADRLELLNDFKSAIIAQSEVQRAQAAFQAKVQKYNETTARIANKDGFLRGTTFNVDATTDTITPVAPPEDKGKKDIKK